MLCRGVRGATTVEANTKEAILAGTREMVSAVMEANGFQPDDVASAFFTTTQDLNAEFPAVAARQLGWDNVPLMCGHEMNVPGSLPMCIRVLLHVNTDKSPEEIVHVYLKGAKDLRAFVPPITPA
ncbi:MAG: Chorismate mutase [Dehalococcoidia bacterium]|nr:Chorismate mutase [Dehalococcoidia bacterium]